MILDKIADATRNRVKKAKLQVTMKDIMEDAYLASKLKNIHNLQPFIFEKALKNKDGISFICEVKKASPSKGIISENFPYQDIALEYEKAGAAAISVLTEPEYFMGKDIYLSQICNVVNIPVLRKDFIIDEYQIYEARVMGAAAVLLICSLLDTYTLRRFLGVCNELGLSALVEAHTKEEIASAIEAGARVIGVNNRNLKTFEVDINNSIRLRSFVPSETIFVAESGIRTQEDIMALRTAGVDAVLIGETLMRSDDKRRQLNILRGLS